MKNLNYYFLPFYLFTFLPFFAFAQNGKIQLNRNANIVECTNSTFAGFSTNINFDAINSYEVENSEGTFSAIYIDGAYNSGDLGAPQLPSFHQLFYIPENATPRIIVKSFTTSVYQLDEFDITTLYPAQQSYSKSEKPENIKFSYNQQLYLASKNSEVPLAEFEVLGSMREIKMGKLYVNPVKYNYEAGTITVYNDIKLEIVFENANAQLSENKIKASFSPYFIDAYKMLFNNNIIMNSWTGGDLLHYPVKMLVIANRMFESALQPWINWKIQKGFEMDVNYTDVIGTTNTALRTFCTTKYNAGLAAGNAPSFVVIIGDVAQVVSSATGSSSQRQTDLYYGSTDGDFRPEMYYSRISVTSATQLTDYLNKSLYYEKYQFEDPTYLDKVTLIAGADSYWNPIVGQPTVKYGRDNYFNIANGFSTVNIYLTTPYTNCYTTINGGLGLINYTAHGSETSWGDPVMSQSTVNALTNTNKPTIAVGNCCLTSDFGYSTCFGETWIRAANKGAVGYIGSSPNSYWYEDYYWSVGAFPFNTSGATPTVAGTGIGVYDVMFNDTYTTLCGIITVGNMTVDQAVSQGNATSVGSQYYWQAYNVLGDGSISPYIKQGKTNPISAPPIVSVGVTTYQLSAQPGSYAAITRNNEIYGCALTNASGVCLITYSKPIAAGANYTLTVTRAGYKPDVRELTVGVAAITYTVTFNANGGVGKMATQTFTEDIAQNLNPNGFTRTNYTFTNWNTNAAGTGTSYADQQSITISANTTLYAQWEQIQATLPITDDFEAHTAFTINPQGTTGWNYFDGDASPTYGFDYIYTFPNMYSPMAAIIFDPSLTTPPHPEASNRLSPHSGNQYLAFFAPSEAPDVMNNDWFISPLINQSSPFTFSFWIRSYFVAYTPEKFRVLYSTSGNNVSNFTNYLAGSATTQIFAPNDWTKFSYTVPANAKYVAIQCVSTDGFIMMLDDVSIIEGVVPNNYTVSFNANGGTGTMANQTFTEGVAQNLTANGFTRTNYTFANWNTNAAGTGTSYANQQSVTISANTTLYAQWVEIEGCNPATNLTAVREGVGTKLTWTLPSNKNQNGNIIDLDAKGGIFEDCENYDDFTQNPTGTIGWKYYENGGTTYGFNGITFPGMGTNFAFTVFNPYTTTPPMNTTASILPHSGQKFFACFSTNVVMPNDHWIVSPQISSSQDFILSFWAKQYEQCYCLDRMKVRYSTTTDEKESFTNYLAGTPTTYATITSNWKKYEYTVPANAKYIAIQSVSYDHFIFMLDDISISANVATNSSANIYRNNIKIAENVTGNIFTDNNPETVSCYQVEMNCPEGEVSEKSNEACLTIQTYTITVAATGGGTVEGGGVYRDGEIATLIAIPDFECDFVKWDDENTEIIREIIVFEDATYTAIFKWVIINENEFSSIKIFPNPTSGELTITNDELQIEKIEIFDLIGKRLISTQLNESTTIQLNISALTSGTYIVEVTCFGKIERMKLVKQ